MKSPFLKLYSKNDKFVFEYHTAFTLHAFEKKVYPNFYLGRIESLSLSSLSLHCFASNINLNQNEILKFISTFW